MEETEALTREIREREEAIETLLARALRKDPALDLNARLGTFDPASFDERPWSSALPDRAAFLPDPPGFFARMAPGASARYERKVTDAESRFQEAQGKYEQLQRERAVAFCAFQSAEETRKEGIEQDNDAVRELQRGLGLAEYTAVVSYFRAVIDGSLQGEPDALSAELGYAPDSKHLVIDLELPDLSAVPEESGYKYVKATDRIDPVPRPVAKRKALYAHLICEIALKCIDTVFRGGRPAGIVDCLTVNGMLDTVDPATGQDVRVCLLSVRVTADTFGTLNLAQVQPEHCLRSLKASVSRAPAELLPVKPLIELDMVDPRFIETMDVMSHLDRRPNLMELTPTEFEGLITNLFGSMGLDTRQTRPSRDGGVDCVAFDPRPVFGGKVVIQAKRYKNTVGVSAVRDLFGTVQNEGASKGILVTTSGYGRAAFDFARGKPLELLDGGNLLHLLAEHAGMEARIVMPEGWVDLPIHGE
ncbi:MAG TPA: restriction endonuclease [Gemmataceae bacterium]|jgi:restriction system protein|nr:restriction endonuclease [Gemmataceae bacterium]